MTIRLVPMITSLAVGKITPRRPTKECIESEAEEAAAEANNLAKSVKTDKGNFDKKKADSTEDAAYESEESDKAEKQAKKDAKKLHEERWDDDYDRDADDQKHTDAADAADDENESDDDYNLNVQGVGYSKDRGGHKRKTGSWKTKGGKTASRTTIDGQIKYSEEIDPSTAKALSSNEGVSMPMFREMLQTTERALNLREAPKQLTKGDLRALVKEEYVKILDEQRKGDAKIESKLMTLRKDLVSEMLKRTSTTKESVGRPPMMKSLQLATVSKLIDVPVNELTLYFLNNVKGSNHHHLIEYHLGHVYFYGN